MLLNNVRQARKAAAALVLGLALGLGAGVPACDSQSADCASVCGRYRDCVDAKYDAAACETRCRDKAGHDRDFDDRLTHCRSCSDGRSCSETVASCIPACVGIVP
jgi:hypothetical protein